VAALVGFNLAGLAFLATPGQPAFWQAAALIGAATSLLLLVFYWHPWLVTAILIDLTTLAVVLSR
jgi:hypothetical protein